MLGSLLAGCSNADVNVRDHAGRTPLHVFVLKGLLGCVVKFVAYGGDPNFLDGEKNSPLHSAAKVGNIEILKALLLFGADSRLKNGVGKTPLDIAATSRDKNFLAVAQYCMRVVTGEEEVPEPSPSHGSYCLHKRGHRLRKQGVTTGRQKRRHKM